MFWIDVIAMTTLKNCASIELIYAQIGATKLRQQV
jgi:hypothetical protein